MNSIERIIAVMEGRIPDRVPIMGNLLEQGADELGMSISEYYSKGEFVAEGQLKLRNKYGYDNLSGFFYAGMEAELLGCKKIIFSEMGPPNVGQLIIKNYKDIEKFEIPKRIDNHPRYEQLADCIRILKAEANGKYTVGGSVVSSFSLPSLLMGMDKWLNLLLNGPESIRLEMLQKSSDFCIKYIQELRKLGVDGVSYSNPIASADFLTPKQFENVALEWIKRDIKSVGPQGITYFNGGGRINPMLKTIKESTGIYVYYIHPHDDIAEAKQIIGDQGVSSGVINDIPLVTNTKDEIYSEVRRIMAEGKEGGRFIFGTLVMPYLIPKENIIHLFDAARKYGEYD